MVGTIFFVAGLLFFALAVHPFTSFPLSLKLLRSRWLRPVTEDENHGHNLTFALCMCAYNEQAVIVKKAENLRALQKAMPGLEVYIYVDCSSDATAELLKPYMNEFHVHVSPERHGKTYGMNLLISQTKADILIFTDANVMLDVDTISRLRHYYADPQIGCVCGHLIYVNGDDEGHTAANGSLYWRLEEKIKQLESDTGSLMGADGSIFSIRRALHHPPPPDIIDDMYVSMNILCDGYRIVRADDVIAYEESVSVAHEEFRRKVRISCQAFNVHRLMWPRLRQLPARELYKYVSHKLIRWFVLYWLVLAALCFELALIGWGLWALALILPVLGIGALAAGFYLKAGPLAQVVDILYAFAATALGVWRSLRGDRFQTWSPAQSIRKAGS
jgi:cellulose synthase/poly-beta-1,6-N-acetylglucosamine synthase-like glycosyltransferase